MENIDQAVCHNNEGVSLLLAGNDKGAVIAFSKSLGIFKELGTDQENQESTPSPTGGASNSVSGGGSCSTTATTTPATTSTNFVTHHSSFAVPNLNDEFRFIYNHAITLPAEIPRETHTIYTCTSCIILNMALVYHRRGSKGDKACMTKAIALYEMVKNLMNCNATYNETFALVQLAAINNLAQINYEHGNFEDVRTCLESLTSLLRRLSGNNALLKKEELNGILLTVFLLSTNQVAPAA